MDVRQEIIRYLSAQLFKGEQFAPFEKAEHVMDLIVGKESMTDDEFIAVAAKAEAAIL